MHRWVWHALCLMGVVSARLTEVSLACVVCWARFVCSIVSGPQTTIQICALGGKSSIIVFIIMRRIVVWLG